MTSVLALTWGLATAFSTTALAQEELGVAQILDQFVQRQVNAGTFTGTALAVRGGQIVLQKAYGLANRATGAANTVGTHHVLASMTKQFTAALVLRQIEAGRLSLDTTVRGFVPGAPASWDGITIQHLLNHSSGLFDYLNSAPVMKRIRHRDLTPTQVIGEFRSRGLAATPGARYSYTNSGYLLLGHILESVTGMKLSALLRRDILDPLGMADTAVYPASDPPADWSTGYVRTGSRWTVPDGIHPSIVFGDGDLYSTVGDLAKWDRALSTDRVLSERSREIMFTPSIDAYGAGYKMEMVEGHRVGWHTGHLVGHANIIMRFLDPADQGTLIVLLGNYGSAPVKDMSVAMTRILFAPEEPEGGSDGDTTPPRALLEGPGFDF